MKYNTEYMYGCNYTALEQSSNHCRARRVIAIISSAITSSMPQPTTVSHVPDA